MLSIKKINAGNGYEYLTRSVVHGDADYYLRGTTAGDPPGLWAGRGAAVLGLDGAATDDQVRNLFGLGVHPADPTQPLGAAFAEPSSALERIRRWEAAHPDAPPEKRAAVAAAQRLRGNRNSIAGLDLTFSPPKSWSVLWAAVSPAERERMWAAHHAGISTALGFLEAHAAFTRTGHDGIRQVETAGLTAVRFDHTTSRAGDVQPHSHLLVSTKVRGVDGRWRSLDAAQVYTVLAAAGALYSTVRDTETARALGTVHELRPDTKEREVAGVPEALRREYSGRRAQIEEQLADLAASWETRYGAPPGAAVRARMSEFLTLRTRPGKRTGESIDQMLDRMQKRAGSAGFAFDTVRDAALGRRNGARDPEALPPVELVATGLAAVTTERAVWTRWHLLRAIENRQSIDTGLTSQQVVHRAEALTDAALAHPDVRRISAPEVLAIPRELRRRIDDESVFVRHGGAVYTTQDLLDAERQLLDAGRRRTGLAVPRELVERVLSDHAAADAALDPSQAAAVRRFTLEDRGLDVLEGPAGSGKSRTMRAVVDAWTAAGRPVLGLALSQQAAAVLAEEAGCRAENIAKFLWNTQHAVHADGAAPDAPGPTRDPAEEAWWRLSPGHLVLIDEAAMADTRRIAAVEALVREAGGVLRAVGDDAQLSSPEAGGWFSLVAEDVAALRLQQLHRFTHDWEADASLRLRAGDPSVIATYADHGRIIGSDLASLETAAYNAWRADERAGGTSLLLVGTNARAARLSARARADLVTMNKVEPGGVELHDGNRAGVGDRVMTRLNDSTNRDLDGRQVANRDHWIVRRRTQAGGLVVERLEESSGRSAGLQVTLSPDYVATEVELAYAAVMAARQGATVTTSHSLADEHTDLSALYMALTRGTDSNILYLETFRRPGEDQSLAQTPEAVLDQILRSGRLDRPVSAHQAIRDAQTGATSLAVLGAVWEDTVVAATRDNVADILRRCAGDALARRAQDDPAWPTLIATIYTAQDRGWHLETVLPAAIAERELDSAEGPAKVLTWRLQRITAQEPGRAGATAPEWHSGTVWPSYSGRTPAGDQPDLVVARQAAELLDSRWDTLGRELVLDPPEWAVRALGPAPEHPADRQDWAARATAVAAYRERYGLRSTVPDAAGDLAGQLLGPLPQATRGEAVALWEHAHAALGEASGLTRLRATDEAGLRAAVAAAEQVEADRPEFAGTELREAALTLRGAQAAEASLRTRADQAAGERGQLSRWGSASAATRFALDAELAALATAIEDRDAVLSAARDRYNTAAAADARWHEWEQRTRAVRRTGRLAAGVLSARGDRVPDPDAGPTDQNATRPQSRLASLLDGQRRAANRTATKVREAIAPGADTRTERERIWQEDQARVLRDDSGRGRPDRSGRTLGP